MVERLEGAGEALRRVLVGEPAERPAAGADEQRGHPPGVGHGGALHQVRGDLLEMAVLAEPGERGGGAAVQARAAERVELAQHRLAHERVGELEPPAVRGGPQQSCAEQLVQRGLGGGGRHVRRVCERTRVELLPEHRGGGQQLAGLVAEPRQPHADRMADALGHLGGLREAAQHLLDEPRVAVRARVHAGGRRDVAEHRAREPRDVVLAQPAQADPVERAVALEVGERTRQGARARQLRVAVRAEHEERRRPVGAQQEAEEQQRAAVGPVEVVEQEERAALASQLGERRIDGVEQLMARAVVRVVAGLQHVGGAGLAERLGERLEGREGVLPAAAEEDRRARVERLAREPVGEPRLADAGLAADQHEAPASLPRDGGPGRAQPLELGRAADERRLVLAEQGRRRWHGGHGRRRAAHRVQQRARLARRRDRERRAQPLGEALARGERRRAVAGTGQSLDEAPVGLLARAGRARPARA